MPQLILRPARLDDLPILLQFEQDLIEAERPFDPTLKTENAIYYDLRGFLTDPKVHLVVAQDGEEIVASGYAQIKMAKDCFKHGPYGYFGFMFTKPSYRGKGINKLISEALYDWCRSKGLSEIRLQVYDDNLAAVKAYQKVGFKKHLVEMRVEI